MVQIVSTCCASVVNREENLLNIRAIKAYPTKVTTNVRTRSAWSWNAIICSIIGEAASWNIS